MLVQAKPFWALLLTAVMVCAYLPLESGSVLPNHNEPALVLPDRNAYDWSVTATYASGESHSHQRSDASNTMTVNNILDGSIEISVDLIGDSSSVWHSALGDVRVFISLLEVPNGTSRTPMEADSGWLIRATQQVLEKPVNSTATATLEVEIDEVNVGECYLVHISVGEDGASDLSATHPTFIFQPLFIEYDGGQCPLKDSDGDGYTDVQENLASSNPNSSSSVPNMTDSDGDGVPDLYDDANCTQSGWTSNASTDHDRDGCKDDLPNQEDDDDDNDGIIDEDEPDCSKSPLPFRGNFSLYDYDGDGCLDFIEDKDSDNDGWCDGDNTFVRGGALTAFDCLAGPDDFPLDPAAWLDTDRDGQPDEMNISMNAGSRLVEDLDDDNDGWSDTDEDTCFGVNKWNRTAHVFPEDYDNDGICDGLDPDDDNDEWNDTDLGDGKIDAFPFNKEEWNDTDGDGVGDNSDDDADGDGWTNEQENQTGNTTSWLDSGSSLDSDGDGWLDGTELLCGSNPNDPNQTPNDLDNDGVCDLMDDDADGDGWTNEQEGWPTDETSWLDPDVTPDTDGDTWTDVHENLTQAVFVNDHVWVQGHLPAWMVSAYIKGDWWNDSDITPDVAISLILTELEQSISTLNEEIATIQQQLNQSDEPCDEVCEMGDMDLDGWSDEEEIRFRENVSVWFDQYGLPYHVLIYEMELEVDKTPATVVHQLLDEIDDLQVSMEALNLTLLTTLEGCLSTCPDLNQTNVTIVVTDPGNISEPVISDAGLVTTGVVSGGVLTAAVIELIRRWRLNNNTGRMKTVGKAFDVARGLRGRGSRGGVIRIEEVVRQAPVPEVEDDIVYGDSDQYTTRGERRQRSLSEAGNLDGAMDYKE